MELEIINKLLELEMINKLFLELSQVSTVATDKELRYENALRAIWNLKDVGDGTLSMRMRLIAKEALK